MIRRPPRSTQSRSSAASDVYKRQVYNEPPTKGTLMLIDSLIGESLRKRLGRTTKAGTLRSADISPMSSIFAVCDVRTTQSTRRIKYAKAFKNSGKRSNFGRGVCWIYDDDLRICLLYTSDA